MIRALQDALYRVGYEVCEGRQPRKHQYASMKRAGDNEADPVGALLAGFADDYLRWFRGWRNLRNSIKVGRPAAIVGPASPAEPGDNYGIGLSIVTADGGVSTDLSRATRISDVVHAIDVTTKLVECVAAAAREALPRDSRDA